MEANQFVDGYTIKKNKFVEQHGKMFPLGSNFSTLLSKLIIFFPNTIKLIFVPSISL
jgi:hypothetical protein